MNIIDFSTHIGIQLFPVQKVVLKAAYGLALAAQQTFSVLIDPEQKVSRDFTEVSYLGYLFAEGRSSLEHVRLGVECRELILALGRRSGKSFLSGLIASYELYRLLQKPDPHAYYFCLNPNIPISLTLLSPGKDQAHLLLKQANSFWKACPEIVALNWLQKSEVLSVLDIPTATFLLLDAEGLAKRIGNLFLQGSVN